MSLGTWLSSLVSDFLSYGSQVESLEKQPLIFFYFASHEGLVEMWALPWNSGFRHSLHRDWTYSQFLESVIS